MFKMDENEKEALRTQNMIVYQKELYSFQQAAQVLDRMHTMSSLMSNIDGVSQVSILYSILIISFLFHFRI